MATTGESGKIKTTHLLFGMIVIVIGMAITFAGWGAAWASACSNIQHNHDTAHEALQKVRELEIKITKIEGTIDSTQATVIRIEQKIDKLHP